jgi:flagellar assembly factor FliW
MTHATHAVAPATKGHKPRRAAETMVVEFPSGIPGFESHRRFVLIASADLSPLGCLKAVDATDVSFLVIDPQLVCLDYELKVSEFDRTRLGAAPDDPLVWLAIVTITEHDAAANLRAPIVINPARMLGAQLIRDDERYPVQFTINLG